MCTCTSVYTCISAGIHAFEYVLWACNSSVVADLVTGHFPTLLLQRGKLHFKIDKQICFSKLVNSHRLWPLATASQSSINLYASPCLRLYSRNAEGEIMLPPQGSIRHDKGRKEGIPNDFLRALGGCAVLFCLLTKNGLDYRVPSLFFF